MISDNTVHGDSIYLRELQNFFFEVLGMMSITHYGARGDGITDNYGYLQVAIDDAHRRGLNYLYVPYGRYIYTGELINIGNLTFIGNPRAHIVNIRTGEEINIEQFGAWGGSSTTEVRNLSDNIVLTDGYVGLGTGFYNTNQYGVYLNSATPANQILGSDELFYYDADRNVIITPLMQYIYQGGAWVPGESSIIENSLSNSDNKIPTSGAVYRALQDIDNERDMITCRLEESYTLSDSSSESLPLTQNEIIGSNFTLNNNGEVVVGGDISRVKVSGMFTIEDFNGATSPIACFIAKNNNRCCDTYVYDTSAGSTTLVSSSIPAFLLSVSQGDVLQLRTQGVAGVAFTGEATSLFNYLTVEAVEYGGSGPTPPTPPEPQYIDFTTACHPSDWSMIGSSHTDCVGTNTYGTWAAYSQYGQSDHQLVNKMWKNTLSSTVSYNCPNNQTFEVILECPLNIYVKPSQINYMWGVSGGSSGDVTSLTVYGMEEGTSSWTQLVTINKPQSAVVEYNTSVSTTKYFSKFKVTRSGGVTGVTVVRMNIKKGTLKDVRESAE